MDLPRLAGSPVFLAHVYMYTFASLADTYRIGHRWVSVDLYTEKGQFGREPFAMQSDPDIQRLDTQERTVGKATQR